MKIMNNKKILTPNEIMELYPIDKMKSLSEQERTAVVAEFMESLVYYSEDELVTRIEIDEILNKMILCKLSGD